jgi:hypothetical protein
MADQPIVADSDASVSNARRIAFTVLAVVFGMGALGGLLGIGIVIGWFASDDGGIHRVHYLGFGVLYGVLLTTAIWAMAYRPETKPSLFWQVVAVAVAAAVGSAVSADGGYVILTAIVAVGAVVLLALHPARGEVLRPRPRWSPVLAALSAAGSVPLVWFALTTASKQRNGLPIDPHVSGDHWVTMAAMSFGLVAVGFVAYGLGSIVFQRFPGTDVPYPGSEGIGWGLVALFGGLAFVAAAEREARREGTLTGV